MGNTVNAMDMSGLSRNGPMFQDNSRNGHNMMVSMANVATSGMGGASGMGGSSGMVSSGMGSSGMGSSGMGSSGMGSSGMGGVSGMSGPSMGLGYVGVENVSRLNPRAPDFAQRHPLLQHKHSQLFSGSSNAANLSSLLMSYQQQQPKPMSHAPPQQHHPYQSESFQSLLERGVGVGMGVNSNVGGVGVGMGWGAGEEEERKPRPIGTERAWKLTAPDDWPHRTDHDRYQQGVGGMSGVVGGHVGVGGVGSVGGVGGVGVGEGYGEGAARAAALSLMHTLPLHYLPVPGDHHWDQPPHHAPEKPLNNQQTWSKWSH